MDYHCYPCVGGGFLRVGEVQVGHCGSVFAACPSHFSDIDTGGGFVRIFQSGGHNDDRPVRGGRRDFPDRTCQDDQFEDSEAGGQQRDPAVPAGDAGDRVHRSFCEQYGDGCPHAADCGESCV